MFGKLSGWRATATLLLFCAWAPLAAEAADLYQAAVEVGGRGVDERKAGIAAALEKVVIKLTGSRAPSTLEAARALGDNAGELVQQYRYAARPEAADGTAWLLWARFDPVATQRALREAGLAVWGGNRPSILLWLGVERDGGRHFFRAEADPALAAAIQRVTDERGMEFLSPLLDLEDLGRLKPMDLWGGFDARVREASERYEPDLVLAGRLQRSGGTVRGEWRLLYGERVESWQNGASDAGQTVELALNDAVDRLARRYAPAGAASGDTPVLVLVRGLTDLEGFLAVQRYFDAMDRVRNLGPVRVDANQALFRLRVDGGVDALRRGASLGRLLSPEANIPSAAPDALAPDLVFRLNP